MREFPICRDPPLSWWHSGEHSCRPKDLPFLVHSVKAKKKDLRQIQNDK